MQFDMAQNRLCAVDAWKVIEERFRPEKNQNAESLFYLANEYMGTRGNFEEGFAGQSLPGCYIGGIYVKERYSYVWQRTGFPDYGNTMVNTTNWLAIKVEVDGQDFNLADAAVEGYRRELDMRNGLVSRRLVFSTRSGAKTELTWERFISHADRHTGAIRLGVKALNHAKPVKVSFILDSTKENLHFANHITHCRGLEKQGDGEGMMLLMNVMSTGQYYVHRMAVMEKVVRSQESGASRGEDRNESKIQNLKSKIEKYEVEDRLIRYSITYTPTQNEQVYFDKLVSVWTSREAGYPHGLIAKNDGSMKSDPAKEKEVVEFLREKSGAHLAEIRGAGYEQLKAAHVARVNAMWERGDIEIEGDEAAQQGIRFCMFHLNNTYLGNDGFLNIGPKGYSGENYEGRTFWDSESYCMPYYLFTNPQAARNLVDYRYNTLQPARERAQELRYQGAMYPMTTIDGTECCAVWEYSLFEIHINCTIAYVVFLYDHATGDKNYLYERGIEVLLEISRFWSSRAAYIPYRQGWGINYVFGPDEWGQFTNNNFYTNYMAAWVLKYTMEVVAQMRDKAPEKWAQMAKKVNFDLAEMDRWRDIAENIILNSDEELDIYVQSDTFLSLDPIFREDMVRDVDIPVERYWSIDKYLKYQLLKQPDVLLAMFLLRDRFSLAEKKSNYRFYEQRCAHGSSLSPCIHSILATEIGRYNQAYEYYLWASRLDLDDYNNNIHEGVHISSMAGTWMTVVAGFGGLVYTSEVIELNPILPPAWTRYSFRFVFRGRTVKVTVDQQQVSYQLVEGAPLPAKVHGLDVTITSKPQTTRLPAEFLNRPKLEGVIFDLDGVIVDTARLHYKAWKELADAEGIYFDERINERLKGVSRMASLDIILERAQKQYRPAEKEALADRKNRRYVEMLETLTEKDILPGFGAFFKQVKAAGIKTAVSSASKNTETILKKLGLEKGFDAVISGNHIENSKPHPEGMHKAAAKMGLKPEACLVIEDAAAGIAAAVAAGMKSIGLGDKYTLHQADYVLPATRYLTLERAQSFF